jgi:hypothetical protein
MTNLHLNIIATQPLSGGIAGHHACQGTKEMVADVVLVRN